MGQGQQMPDVYTPIYGITAIWSTQGLVESLLSSEVLGRKKGVGCASRA